MTQSISEYISSDEFRKRMKRVSAKSRPYGNSTPSEEVYEFIAKSFKRKKESKNKK